MFKFKRETNTASSYEGLDTNENVSQTVITTYQNLNKKLY